MYQSSSYNGSVKGTGCGCSLLQQIEKPSCYRCSFILQLKKKSLINLKHSVKLVKSIFILMQLCFTPGCNLVDLERTQHIQEEPNQQCNTLAKFFVVELAFAAIHVGMFVLSARKLPFSYMRSCPLSPNKEKGRKSSTPGLLPEPQLFCIHCGFNLAVPLEFLWSQCSHSFFTVSLPL